MLMIPVLFICGVLFGYFLVLPYSLRFLTSWMNPEQVMAIFSVGQFLTLEFAMPTYAVEGGYAFTVPGTDASLPVVVP